MSLPRTIITLAGDIKLAHSVFAMPFALLGGFMAARYMGMRYTPGMVGLIVLCMVFARTLAMLANRYFDRRIDAANPRTAGRALPSGRLRGRDVLIAMAANLIAFELCTAAFGLLYGNWFPLILSPLFLAVLLFYPLTKRFTFTAHFFLGGALALSPVAAAIAVAPMPLAYSPNIWLLAAFVLMWVAGFDIIYAIQDINFDRSANLHSIPAKLGRTGALIAARVCHLLGLVALVALQRLQPEFAGNRITESMNIGYFGVGLILVGVLLIIEHRAAAAGKFTLAFFTLNGVISIALCSLAAADLITFGR